MLAGEAIHLEDLFWKEFSIEFLIVFWYIFYFLFIYRQNSTIGLEFIQVFTRVIYKQLLSVEFTKGFLFVLSSFIANMLLWCNCPKWYIISIGEDTTRWFDLGVVLRRLHESSLGFLFRFIDRNLQKNYNSSKLSHQYHNNTKRVLGS